MCVTVQKGVPLVMVSSRLSHGKPHRESGVLGWLLKIGRRRVCSTCKIEEMIWECTE